MRSSRCTQDRRQPKTAMIRRVCLQAISTLLLWSASTIPAHAFLTPAGGKLQASNQRLFSTTASAPASAPESPLRTVNETRDDLKVALLERLGAPKVLDPVLACPVSLRPLSSRVALAGPFVSIEYKVCSIYGTKYRVNDGFADLVPQDEKKNAPFWKLSPRELGTQELFRSPFTSFLYERGWRQNFNNAGFPGIDKEAVELLSFLEEGDVTGTVVDLSCGSGLMTRRLVKSGRFSRVIGADYSESMLRETARRFRVEGMDAPELVRCDAARLPFQTASLDAIHAGAALHCWPALEDSLREVYRVLKPGGRFYASTFEAGYMGNAASNSRNSFRFFQLNELKALLMDSGFPGEKVDVRREGTACLIAKAIKPMDEVPPSP